MPGTTHERRLRTLLGATLLLLLAPSSARAQRAASSPPPRPLTFVENRGQWAPETEFLCSAGGVMVRVERAALALRAERAKGERREGHVVRLEFEGAREGTRPVGVDPRPGLRNYYRGPRERWATGVRGFARVRWHELHPGIDLVLREGAGVVEYDLLVAAGADLTPFVVRCDGVDEVTVAEDGALLLETDAGPIRQAPPTTWMETALGPVPVECAYVRLDDTRFGLVAPDRDPELPLVVDPGLVWSTFLGGSGEEYPRALHVDPVSGAATVTGLTDSADFPTLGGPYRLPQGQWDAYVARLSADGSTLEWATYLGGSLNDGAHGLAVDAGGTVTLGGYTDSDDFPVTMDAYQSARAGIIDGFLSRIDSGSGQLVYSTYFGGTESDWIVGLQEGAPGVVTVSGLTFSDDLDTTTGAYDDTHNGGSDVFVARIDTTSSQLVWSTYLGGATQDGWGLQHPPDLGSTGQGLCLTDAGEVVVVGSTGSANFPTTMGAYQGTRNGVNDLYVSKLSDDGATLVYSTYFGGSWQEGTTHVTVDAQGRLVFSGFTFSPDLDVTPGALQPWFGGQHDAFLAILDPAGQGSQDLAMCTYVGDSADDTGLSPRVTADGHILLCGFTGSPAFSHLTPGCYDDTHNGSRDAFFLRLDPTAVGPAQLVYGTFVGGSLEDTAWHVRERADGTVVLAGLTYSDDFPVTPAAYDTTWNGGSLFGDAWLLRLDPRLAVGDSYCAALPNSTGAPAGISACGSPSLAENDFVLRATPVPDQPFLFFTGPDQIQLPFGDGFRCVGGTVTRIHPAGLASANLAERFVDLNALGIAPGTANFQCWYRDPAGPGGSGFNLSDAVSVVFTP